MVQNNSTGLDGTSGFGGNVSSIPSPVSHPDTGLAPDNPAHANESSEDNEKRGEEDSDHNGFFGVDDFFSGFLSSKLWPYMAISM